jgi:hypothetical protein
MKEETFVKIICVYCQKEHQKLKTIFREKKSVNKFCSVKCWNLSKRNKIKYKCKNCDIDVYKTPSQYKKVKGSTFCSKSCAATYNNTHKTKGNRRSKLEIWIEQKLQLIYPTMEFKFNNKEAINSELDIYIPSLQLAFELNGIFHYEPIYGSGKLTSIQNNDNRKYQACLERCIELCIIDTSQQKYFKSTTAQKYLDIICNVITSKIEMKKTVVSTEE